MERSGRTRDPFGVVSLFCRTRCCLLTFEGGWLIQPLAWMLCSLKATILAHKIVKVPLQAAPSWLVCFALSLPDFFLCSLGG